MDVDRDMYYHPNAAFQITEQSHGSSVKDAMTMLASRPGALFIGQNVAVDGSAMYHDLAGVPMHQRVEFPVAEELQLGASVGLAMQGYLPISVFPRMDFLMRAMDSLVNHLDKLPKMSNGQWQPKVIIRTRIGQRFPLDAGPQHTQDHCDALRMMLTTVQVLKIWRREDALLVYERAVKEPGSVIVAEDF